MTVQELAERIHLIRMMAHDDEKAHGMEDDLREDVLIAIASSQGDEPDKLAALVLTTGQIQFSRWCA